MEIQQVNIINLKPYAKNAKIHTKEQIELIKKSITEFGFNVPIVIDTEKNIICGHGRYQAAKHLSLEQVPCIQVDHLSEEQIKAFRIMDNKSNECDWDLDFVASELEFLKAKDYDFTMSGFSFDFNTEIQNQEVIREKEYTSDINIEDTYPQKEPIGYNTENVKFEKTCPNCGHKW